MTLFIKLKERTVDLVVCFVLVCGLAIGCDKNKNQEETGPNKGIGPISSVDIGSEIDAQRVANGKAVFDIKCSSCHKLEEKYIGPALGDVTDRRTPEWIMNMILNPEQMTSEDPDAQELLNIYPTQMVSQGVSEEEARDLLEFFRDANK